MLVYVIPDNKIKMDTWGQVLIKKNSRIKKKSVANRERRKKE
jgi:hypothetical protein